MSIFNLFLKPKERNFISGVIEDSRPPEEKRKDYQAEEVFGDAPLIWIDWNEWKMKPENQKMLTDFQIYNQDGSGSCVANAAALILSIQNYQEEGRFFKFSTRDIYSRRSNKPNAGMIIQNMAEIITKRGATLDYLLPADQLNEAQMNDLSDYKPSYEAVGQIYKAANYLFVAASIDKVAQILAKGDPVGLGVAFGNGEWAKEVPTIEMPLGQTPWRHEIAALPKGFFTYNGKRAILIQDSWGVNTGLNGRRILTEDWFTDRVFSPIYFGNLNNLAILNGGIEKPKYEFKNDLGYGMKNSEVAMLQRCLGYWKDADGYLFPLTQEPTGHFGGLTLKAVKRFQALYGIEQTGFVGPITRAKLNEIFD